MRFRLTVLALALALVAGCSGASKPRLAWVSGKVTLDDRPLAEGVIVFTMEGEVPRELPIANGSYEGQAFVGTNRIQFAVYRQAALPKRSGPGADEPSRENILPSRYNQESTETRAVKADGPNQLDFRLKSK